MIPNDQFTFEKLMETFVSGYEYHFIFNLLCCLVAGFLIGANRERKGKAAGISTQSLVIAGSMICCHLSFLIPSDPVRLISQILPSVGFLGAGLILKKNDNQIANLTTAASIWYSSSVGMAIGFGQYLIALAAVVYALVVFTYLPHFKGRKDDEKSEETTSQSN